MTGLANSIINCFLIVFMCFIIKEPILAIEFQTNIEICY